MVSTKSLKGVKKNLKVGILTGPTATGKSALALEYCLRYSKPLQKIEIINADSLLVYRGMNIGTAKPTQEELSQVPHHLVDIRNPDEPFTAGDFYRETLSAVQAIHERGHRALIVGGTGFYLKALLYGLWPTPPTDQKLREDLRRQVEVSGTDPLYQRLAQVDPQSAKRIGKSDPYRLIRAIELIALTGKTPTELQATLPHEPDPRFQLWVLDREPTALQERIRLRTLIMLEQGLIEEYQTLRTRYPEKQGNDYRPLHSVGYAQVGDYLKGVLPQGRKIKPGIEGLSEEIQLATRQLVKQQRTWFRGQKTASWFLLDEQRTQLEDAFKAVYV